MDAIALIARAADAGLALDAGDGILVVRGPAKFESLAQELLDHKAEVLALITGQDARVWSCAAAREHFLERLAVADDLGLDTEPGFPALAVALREARRVAAGFPPAWSGARAPEAIDAALAAFEPAGGLRFVRLMKGPLEEAP